MILILFFAFIILFITISFITFLLIFNPHSIPLDIGIIINPIPLRDIDLQLDVVAIITIVSIDFNIVVNILYFLHIFLDL